MDPPRSGHAISLPHARGGVSQGTGAWRAAEQSSPRPWGCFRLTLDGKPGVWVFPTPVGVFPYACRFIHNIEGLPHARGGVSKYCSFSTGSPQSSPRPWGCFCCTVICTGCITVFPTPVGVFLLIEIAGKTKRCLPHARGGVSYVAYAARLAYKSSPRPWGCFQLHAVRRTIGAVFPTPVGVFPH